MIVQLASVLFFSFLVLHGRGFLIFLGKVSNLKFFRSNLSLLPLYGLLSIVLLSNQLFLLNYFFSTKSVILFFLFFNIFFLLQNISLRINSFKNIYYLILPITLSVSTFGQNIHPDADWYGIPYQFLIRNSKIIVGTNIIDWPMSQTGIMDYLMSIFWLNNNFVLVHFIVVSVFSCLFIFLINSLLNPKNKFFYFFSFYIFIFSFLDNFGISGGANSFVKIQMTGKFDSVQAIYMVITFVNLVYLLQKKEIAKEDYLILSILFLYIVQLKTTGIAFGFSFIVLCFYFKKYNRISLTKLFKVNIVPIFLAILWFLRNILVMGCLSFPVEVSCLNFSWTQKEKVQETALIISEWYEAYTIGDNIISWFSQWFIIDKNYQQFGNFIISLLILLGFFIIFVNKKRSQYFYLYFFQIFIGLLLWLVSAPTPRFAFGYFTLTAGIFALFSSSFKLNIFNKKLIIYPLVIVSIILTNRLYSYQDYLQSTFEVPQINSLKIDQINSNDYFIAGKVITVDCNNLLPCNLDFSNYLTSQKFSYLILIPQD